MNLKTTCCEYHADGGMFGNPCVGAKTQGAVKILVDSDSDTKAILESEELLPPMAARRFKIGDVVRNSEAVFSHYRDGSLYYIVTFSDPASPETGILRYQFPITVEEAKGGVFLSHHKAITLMRWIRKAMEGHDFWPAK